MDWRLLISYSETSVQGKPDADTDAFSGQEGPLNAFLSVKML